MDGFQKSFRHCALDESSIGRVKCFFRNATLDTVTCPEAIELWCVYEHAE